MNQCLTLFLLQDGSNMNIFINTRNGIEIINLDKVVYLKADGNYTDFYLSDGKVKTQLSTLAVFDDIITKSYDKSHEASPFFRMGRSYIVNIPYVSSVNFQSNAITFDSEKVRPLIVNKSNLKALRDHIVERYDL